MKNCNVCKSVCNDEFAFCPTCGEALTEAAKKIQKTKVNNYRLEAIYAIIDLIDDETSLKKIKKVVESLKED